MKHILTLSLLISATATAFASPIVAQKAAHPQPRGNPHISPIQNSADAKSAVSNRMPCTEACLRHPMRHTPHINTGA